MDFVRILHEHSSDGGGGMASNGHMSSHMGSTFSDWNSYKIVLVFQGYDIETPWQFGLTCLAVALASMFLHYVECLVSTLRSSMIQTLVHQNTESSVIAGGHCANAMSPPTLHATAVRPRGWRVIKLVSSILSGLKYIYYMLLMLVAMSFNPLLVLSLVVGYFVGDYLCCDFHVDMKMGVYNTLRRGFFGPSINWLLCSKNSSDEEDGLIVENQRTDDDA